MWAAKFSENAIVQYSHFVEVDDGIQLMCYCNDGVARELLSDDALNQSIRHVVNTEGTKNG